MTEHGLRRYISTHASLDPHSACPNDHRYRVHSIYLDSPGLRLNHDTVQGVRNRYKLRLRYYEEQGDGPVFFEVKKRADIIVRKNLELVTREQAGEFLLTGRCDRTKDNGDDLNEFFDRCRESGARPALRGRYWREAWESRGVDPVRITFDSDVDSCLLSAGGLRETRPQWQRTPFNGPQILEIKFTDLRPHWVTQMLRIYQLDKISVAKCANSIDNIRRTGRLAALEAHLRLARSRRNGDRVH